jgi:hypothetical protein
MQMRRTKYALEFKDEAVRQVVEFHPKLTPLGN